MSKSHIEFLEHTADIGIKIKAPTLEQLFILAAEGMFEIIIPNRKVNSLEIFEVQVNAIDREELFINWLSELNYLFQTQQFLLNTVSEIQVSDKSLSAKISGEKIDPERHPVETEIKAITFHKLFIRQEKTKWTAQVIFDI